jgi:hypothetical protein
VSLNGKLPVWSLRDFVELRFDQEYLIDPLLPAGGIGILHGKGGHGKTQFTLTLMNEVARGGRLFGEYGVQQGKVVLFQFDMPEQVLQTRLTMALPAISRPENIVVVPYHKPINILDAEKGYAAQIADIIAAHEPALVVFDTLRKLHPYDENDNAVPSQVYGKLTEVCAGAAALVLHHDRKASLQKGAVDDNDVDARESFRGARAWVDDCDLGMRLRKRGPSVMIDYSKQRCEEQPPMTLQMNPQTLLLEPRPPQTAQEWTRLILTRNPGISRPDLVRLTQEQARVSRQVANDVVKRVLDQQG